MNGLIWSCFASCLLGSMILGYSCVLNYSRAILLRCPTLKIWLFWILFLPSTPVQLFPSLDPHHQHCAGLLLFLFLFPFPFPSFSSSSLPPPSPLFLLLLLSSSSSFFFLFCFFISFHHFPLFLEKFCNPPVQTTHRIGETEERESKRLKEE